MHGCRVPSAAGGCVRTTLGRVSASPFDLMSSYISSTLVEDCQATPASTPGDSSGSVVSVEAALSKATADAAELGVDFPDAATGSLLSVLASQAGPSPSAIVVTPAASVVGLHIVRGARGNVQLTCIDPEVEHQRSAREAFASVGLRGSQTRFLPSRPLEVMGRLAADNYQLVFAQTRPQDARALVDAALPLLVSGGALVLADYLLDGTVADSSRTERDIVAARETDEHLRRLAAEGRIVLSRLPLGEGMAVATKVS